MKTSRSAIPLGLAVLALAVPSLVHAQEAPANSSPAIAPKDEVVKLSPFEVRESTDKTSYRATESTSGSGIALPIRHIPVPIEVVTQALIEDRGALDLLSASYLVSGVVTGGPVLTGQESWRIHGYSAPGLRNGFRLDNDTTDASEIERIEVASGPASVLYGAGATGGAVNRITKKPKFVQEGRVSAGFGDYDYYQGMIDVTGPVPFLERDGKPTLAYRAIVSTNNISSDVDWYERTRNAFNGSLRWQPTDRLNFTAEISSNQRKGRPSVEITEGLDAGGAIAYAKDPTGRGYSFSIAGPDSYDNMRGDAIEFTMDFHITDSLVLNAAYVDHDSSMQNLRSRRIDLFGRNLPAQLESGNEWVDQQLWRANLLWEWEGNGIDNKLVLGADGSTDHNRALVYRISNWVPPADYSITSAVRTALFSANPNTNRNRTTYLRSYRVVDFMNLLDNRLHILASVARTEPTKQKDTVTNTYVTLRGDTTMQAGVVYDFTRDISGFVNYSTDFVPNTQTGPTGNVLDPQEGVGIDFGLKFAMFDGQLTGSLSYFDEERTNIPLRIGQTSFFELSGKDRSRGFDFNFLYTPSPVWSLKFGGSIFEAETIANTADPTQVGLPPQDVCPRSLNFQSTWHGRGRMKGFSFGVGGIWHDDYPTESATNKRHVRTDDVALYDAFARYGFDIGGHVASFTVNVSNVSDKRAYIINQEAFGPPRMIRGTLRYDF